MTRKDNEKESERPHYYSQFWLDVAAGRRVIGAPKPGSEETETYEQEMGEHTSPRRAARASSQSDLGVHSADGHAEKIAHPVVEPVVTPEEFIEPIPEDLDLALEDEDQLPPEYAETEDIEAPDMDFSPIEEEEEDFYDEDEEEEEEDVGWGGRGRKKPSPKRPTRQPPKKPKRDRRSY
jgi:hypothetical protein